MWVLIVLHVMTGQVDHVPFQTKEACVAVINAIEKRRGPVLKAAIADHNAAMHGNINGALMPRSIFYNWLHGDVDLQCYPTK